MGAVGSEAELEVDDGVRMTVEIDRGLDTPEEITDLNGVVARSDSHRAG